MSNCPKCGIRILGDADACPFCDKKNLSTVSKSGVVAKHICPKCGIRLLGDATNCPVCDSPEAQAAQGAKMTNEQRQQRWRSEKEYRDSKLYGSLSRRLVCPHCQTAGHVHTKSVKKKVGISGGKVTGALLTGGISLLATGLSRKEAVTQAHCTNCSSNWYF